MDGDGFPFQAKEVAMRASSRSFQHQLDRTIYSEPAASVGHDFVDELLAKSFVHAEDWKQLARSAQERLLACQDRKQVLKLMVENRLLTDYQATRIIAGTTFGL